MAQYDIHRAAVGDGEVAPFLIDIQSNEYRQTGTRVVIPLVRGTGFPSSVTGLVVDGARLAADALSMASVPKNALGDVVRAMTPDEVSQVTAILDRIISSAYS